MPSQRILLRGGTVITMDPRHGTLPCADVLIENGLIEKVAPHIEADAEIIDVSGHIVMPGMIDTHRHTWQTLLRSLCADWTLIDYIFGVRLAVANAYTAEDMYLGNLLGSLDAINSGVTTLLDFSHCTNTPEHADGAITGLRDAGVRAVFGYGFYESNRAAPPHFTTHDERLADLSRVAGTWFSGRDGLLTLGVALTEQETIPFETVRAEILAAREHDALMVTHTGSVWGVPTGIAELAEAGLLGPDQVHVHCNSLSDNDWQLLAEHGAKVSISPETELNMGMGRPVFAAAERHGIKPTLSCDIASFNSGDLFTQLRVGLGFHRWAETEEMNLRGVNPEQVKLSAEAALQWTTTNAADAIGQADRIGALRAGMSADIVVIGGPGTSQHPQLDPAGTVVFQTGPEDVRHVLIDGRFVKRDGALVGVDLPHLLGAADTSAENILKRVGETGRELPGTPREGWQSLAAQMVPPA
ncbi:amidohydrolase family protein (plasmid) [Streptomyces sp. HUAS 31]|uniref:amidohydrolase family protein n=1 Tax=Streptomyces sp. HUAS 31 TaxID=3020055 RepID=UPI0023053AC7|nr:amidohydrolase family protein [Streptomyces sp. HUAS 31]WCE02504.1 amidohydrolase family protein [Streptomyces sp. HUAS 31]